MVPYVKIDFLESLDSQPHFVAFNRAFSTQTSCHQNQTLVSVVRDVGTILLKKANFKSSTETQLGLTTPLNVVIFFLPLPSFD